MEIIVYIIKIIFFYSLGLISYGIAKKYQHTSRFPWIWILIISAAFGYYNTINGGEISGSDRGVYAYLYKQIHWDISEGQSVGLNWIYNQLRPISLDPYLLFFVIYALYAFLTLVAYKFYKAMHPVALFMLLGSFYMIFGFYGFKQEISQGLSSLAFALYFTKAQSRNSLAQPWKKLFKFFLIVFLIVGCISFHEAGLIVIPVFLALVFWEFPLLKNFAFLAIIIVLLAGSYIVPFLFSTLAESSNEMQGQLSYYAGSVGTIVNGLPILKGAPFYLIAFIAIQRIRILRRTIPNYDKYLFVVCVAGLSNVIALYQYWFQRLALYFYLPAFCFAYLMKQEMEAQGYTTRWYNWTLAITLLLSLKEIVQLYFLYGGV
jgi:hypothetical protein